MSKKKLIVKTSPDVQQEMFTDVVDKVEIVDIDSMINVYLTPEVKQIVKASAQFYPKDINKIAQYVNSLSSTDLVKTLGVFYPIPSEE